MSRESIHIKPIRAEHHGKLTSHMGEYKGHKLGEVKAHKIRKEELEYEDE